MREEVTQKYCEESYWYKFVCFSNDTKYRHPLHHLLLKFCNLVVLY